MIWKLIAKIAAWGPIADHLIATAMRTPYEHLNGYMCRWWLVPYNTPGAGYGCGMVNPYKRPIAWLLQKCDVAIRVHWILREDLAPHPHTHPWTFRTIILRRWYKEERDACFLPFIMFPYQLLRQRGDTAVLEHGQAHKITEVAEGGAWTLFITFKKQSSWGFMDRGREIPWREYQGRN